LRHAVEDETKSYQQISTGIFDRIGVNLGPWILEFMYVRIMGGSG
jgi:hypothetical protein